MASARNHPGVALHVVRGLSDEARAAFVSEVAKPEWAPRAVGQPGVVKCAPRRPGPAKGWASPFSEARGYALQLGLFARSVARVR
nr:MAG: hypothetical protein DIU78_18430 [Pseudomonadota bacterium]